MPKRPNLSIVNPDRIMIGDTIRLSTPHHTTIVEVSRRGLDFVSGRYRKPGHGFHLMDIGSFPLVEGLKIRRIAKLDRLHITR